MQRVKLRIHANPCNHLSGIILWKHKKGKTDDQDFFLCHNKTYCFLARHKAGHKYKSLTGPYREHDTSTDIVLAPAGLDRLRAEF